MKELDFSKIKGRLDVYQWWHGYMALEPQQKLVVGTLLVTGVMFVLLWPISFVKNRFAEQERLWQQDVAHAVEYFQLEQEYKAWQNTTKSNDQVRELGADPLKKIVYEATSALLIENNRVTLKTLPQIEADSYIEVAKEVSVGSISLDTTLKLLLALQQERRVSLAYKKVLLQMEAKNPQIVRSLQFTILMRKAKQEAHD